MTEHAGTSKERDFKILGHMKLDCSRRAHKYNGWVF